MPKITIYTTFLCPYCQAAKELLTAKGAAFEEIDVSYNPDMRRQMSAEAGGATTVPQIWIGDRHIGGSDDLQALDGRGKLDAMLAGA